MKEIDFIPIEDWLTLQDDLKKPKEKKIERIIQRIIQGNTPDDWHEEEKLLEEYLENEETEEEE